MSKATILGAGYVGVPTAAHFSRTHQITIYDPDQNKLDNIRNVMDGSSNSLHIHESGLPELLRENRGNIRLCSNIEEALQDAEFIFISVGTPPNDKGRANLKYVCAAAAQIGQNLTKEAIILNKSTVPPGTAYLVQELIAKNLKAPVNFHVGSCPEFLAEGTAVEDLRTPDRIVYGCDDAEALQKVTEFFSYLHGKATLCPMTTVSSELTKYAANAILATKISFMNSMAVLCDNIGANIREVQDGLSRDARIGRKFLNASMGYGGSCFPKDTKAIVEYANLQDVALPIIKSTININQFTTEYFTDKIISDFNDQLKDKNFIIWGVGFKARTDDLRDSKAVEVARKLMDHGGMVHIYDTVDGALLNFENENQQYQGQFALYRSQYDMDFSKMDALIIGNEHEKFRNPNIEHLDSMRSKHIYDGKNVLSNHLIRKLHKNGYIYKSVGKDSVVNGVQKSELIAFLQEKYMD